MNKATLFAVVACALMMTSFHHPQGSATMASTAVQPTEVSRTISSEKPSMKKAELRRTLKSTEGFVK